MLILTRRVNETILIGDNIKVILCSVETPNKVRIGVEAPPEITILRGELVRKDEHDKE